jgi:hypothetical protein
MEAPLKRGFFYIFEQINYIMNVSSNTLFHYTKSLKNLQNILQNRFKLAYCKEEINFNGKKVVGYFPMVTFCDIPLSLSKEHVTKYGSYAIGLQKEWGIKHKLNPVIYLEEESMISEDLRKSFELINMILSHHGEALNRFSDRSRFNLEKIEQLVESAEGIEENKIFENLNGLLAPFVKGLDEINQDQKLYGDLLDHIKQLLDGQINILRYCKNYQRDLKRDGKMYPNYRFYDEREWRFVPSMSSGIPNLIEDEYKKYRGGSKIKKPLLDFPVLDFSASDIKYIIVKKSSDISPLITFMRGIDNFVNNGNEVDILSTKIITVDQLNEDF